MKASTTSWAALAVATFSLCFWSQAALAGPNCDRKPDHPSCSDGGGGDGGGDGGTGANPALVFWDGKDSIDVTDADGGNRTVLLGDRYGGCTFAKWSPDGERVVYPPSFRIFVVNKDGSGDTDVTPAGVVWSGACAIDWSQGRVLGGSDLIAFVGTPEEYLHLDFPESAQYDDVYLLNPNTGDAHKLTNCGFSENAVSWSHDGTSLAVTRVDFNDPSHQRLVILRLDVDGSGVPFVAQEQDITPPGVFEPWNQLNWASGSDRILYTTEGDIRMVTFDSSGLLSVESITGGPGQFNLGRENWPSWAPGDEELVFVVTGPKQKDIGVYRMNLSDGTAEKIMSGTSFVVPHWPDWSPVWSEAP